jgi:hypothetical protein
VNLVSEEQTPEPINPYGQTKLIGEWMAKNAQTAWGLNQVSLRYFNVAGAGWPDLADTQKLNLIPIVFADLKANTKPKVFGTDYPTPDGSAIGIASYGTPYINAYPWSSSGFGTKFANPSTLPNNDPYGVAFSK